MGQCKLHHAFQARMLVVSIALKSSKVGQFDIVIVTYVQDSDFWAAMMVFSSQCAFSPLECHRHRGGEAGIKLAWRIT